MVSISQNFPSQNPLSRDDESLHWDGLKLPISNWLLDSCDVTQDMAAKSPAGHLYSSNWSRKCTANLDVVVAVFHGKPYTCAVDVKKDLAACSAAGHSRTSPMFKMLPSANVNLSSSSWNTRFSATISKFSSWALSFCRLNLQFTCCQVVTFPLFIDCVGETFDLRLKSSWFYEVFRQPQMR